MSEDQNDIVERPPLPTFTDQLDTYGQPLMSDEVAQPGEAPECPH